MIAPPRCDNARLAPSAIENTKTIERSNHSHSLQAGQSDSQIWPAAGSIKRQILDALLAGQKLTSLDAWARFGTSRLAGLIHQLRGAGWQIEAETIEVETSSGRRAHVARYWIAEDA